MPILLKMTVLLASLAALVAGGDEVSLKSRDTRALAPLQPYVGQWRGVGLPRRGSNAGAWTEKSEWTWRFEKGRAELVGRLQGDKFYKQLRVQPAEQSGQFVLLASVDEGHQQGSPESIERFTGTLKDDVLIVTAVKPASDRPARISVRLVAGGDRMLVHFEKRISKGIYRRMAEVGSTRKGSSFAKNAASGPECVVTGGLGTITVVHNGKTYYVCCGGCRDLFLEDPQGVLAEYRQRKAAERAEDEE